MSSLFVFLLFFSLCHIIEAESEWNDAYTRAIVSALMKQNVSHIPVDLACLISKQWIVHPPKMTMNQLIECRENVQNQRRLSICESIMQERISKCDIDEKCSILFTPSSNVYVFEIAAENNSYIWPSIASDLKICFFHASYNASAKTKVWGQGVNKSHFYIMLTQNMFVSMETDTALNSTRNILRFAVPNVKSMEMSWFKNGYFIKDIRRVSQNHTNIYADFLIWANLTKNNSSNDAAGNFLENEYLETSAVMIF